MDSPGTEDHNNIDFTSLAAKINDALFKLELFWNTGSHEYEYFGFKKHFTPLFAARDKSMFNVNLFGIDIDKYWDVIHKINFSIENINKIAPFREEFPGMVLFFKDIQEICDLHAKRIKTTGIIYPYDSFALCPGKISFTYLLKERPYYNHTLTYSPGSFYKNYKRDMVLFSALSQLEYSSIVDYWLAQQSENPQSPLIFFTQLSECWHFYNSYILSYSFYDEEDFGFVSKYGYFLIVQFSGTDQKFHLGRPEMKLLYENLQELYECLGLEEPNLIIRKEIDFDEKDYMRLPITMFKLYMGDDEVKTHYSLNSLLVKTKNNVPEFKRSLLDWYKFHPNSDLLTLFIRRFINAKLSNTGKISDENVKAQYFILNSFIDKKPYVEKAEQNPPDDSLVESLLAEYSEYFNTFELEPESTVSIEALSTTGATFSSTLKPLMQYSSFQGIFFNGFNFTKQQVPFIKPKVFCGYEIAKIEKWLANIEDACKSSGLDIREYKLSQEYLRLEAYLDYLSELRTSNQFDFLNDLTDDESNPSNKVNERFIGIIDSNESSIKISKFVEFSTVLKEHSFFSLPMVICLSVENQEKLIHILFENDFPYKIAFFNFLGFIKYFEKNFCDNKKDMHKKLASILGSTDRAIRGNINVLSVHSKEDRYRYTSHQYIETVTIDYNKLK